MPIWSQYVDLIEAGLRTLADFTGSAGLSIILFTILIKTVLLPLTVKSVRSTYAMQELQPKVKELQKRFGKDRQRLSQETMKLYQEHGVNPAAGCLPMLIQIPIFFGLYFAIQNLSRDTTGTWEQSFLWIDDLAQADPYKILPILAGVFQFVQTRMTRPAGQGKAADPQQQMMYTMMNFMPLMVVIFGWTFAAGPVLYWVVQAIYSVVQQWLIAGWGAMKEWFPFLPDMPEHRRLGYESPEKRAERAKKGGSGLMGRLNQKLQEQQERLDAEQSEPAAPATNRRSTSTAASRKTAKRSPQGNGRTTNTPPQPRPDLVPRRSRSSKSKGPAERD